MPKKLKTVEEVRAEFAEAGISVAGWARAHGFCRVAVMSVLSGRSKNLRGSTHLIAIALGLKAGRVVDVRTFKAPPAPERRKAA